jgi:hypothetical protein
VSVPRIEDDPWSVDYHAQIQLAKSLLGHADSDDIESLRTAVDRALLALNGATIDELRRISG